MEIYSVVINYHEKIQWNLKQGTSANPDLYITPQQDPKGFLDSWIKLRVKISWLYEDLNISNLQEIWN